MADDADRAQELEQYTVYRRKYPRDDYMRLSEDCITCGDPIDVARLKAVPKSVRCIHCQSAWEKSHGR